MSQSLPKERIYVFACAISNCFAEKEKLHRNHRNFLEWGNRQRTGVS